MGITFEYYMSAASSVPTVGPTFGYVFGSVEMAASRATFARTAKYLYVVYEI